MSIPERTALALFFTACFALNASLTGAQQAPPIRVPVPALGITAAAPALSKA